MKKTLTLLVALIMAFTLVACGAPATTEPPVAETSATTEPSEAPAGPPVAEEVKGVTVPEFVVNVNGVAVDQNMMAEYPLYSVTATSVNSTGTESTSTYVGFMMKDVFTAAGLTENYVWLEATADDGYAVNSTGDAIMQDTTLLAISEDGSPFASAPWYAPCTSETTGDYLKNMVSILVNTEDGPPADVAAPEAPAQGAEGGEEAADPGAATSGPQKEDRTDKVEFADFSFKVNGNEITNADMEGRSIYKVTVTTENKSGESSESTYTGYELSDVIEVSGITDPVTVVKAVANDGYEMELTPEQIASENTIIAIEKDKELGEDGTIWVAPCDETTSSAYAKLVVDIIAE